MAAYTPACTPASLLQTRIRLSVAATPGSPLPVCRKMNASDYAGVMSSGVAPTAFAFALTLASPLKPFTYEREVLLYSLQNAI